MRRFVVIIFALLVITLPATAQKKKITLDEIWLRYRYFPQYPNEFRWMKNDQFYSVVTPEEKEGNIVGMTIDKYSITDEKKVETLLDLAKLDFGASIKLKDIDSYDFSEDEKKMVLKAKVEPIYRHSTKEICFVWDNENKKLIPLHEGKKISYATFSPDGKKIGYVGENNMYYYDFATQKEKQITADGVKNKIINGGTDWVYEEEFSFAQAFAWSPDSRRIAYYRFDESEVKEFSMDLYTGLYPEQYRFKYPKAGEKNSLVEVHIYDTEAGKITAADLGTEKDQYIPRIKWTKNAEVLAVMRMNRLQNKLEVLAVNAQEGKSSVILKEETPDYIEITDDKWMFFQNSADFLWLSEEDGFNHIYRYGIDGKLVGQLTKGDFEVSQIVGIDDKNDKIYFLSTEISPLERQLYSISLKGTNKKRLTQEEGNHDITFSSACTYYVDSYSSTKYPSRTKLCKSADGVSVKTLVENKELFDKINENELSTPEMFKFKTSQNVELNGWMIKPTNFDATKKYPVLMYVYGGPGHQTVKNEWGLGARGFDFMWYQMLAENGYVIVSVDGRGTGGRGAKFRKTTYANLGKYELEDQVEAANYLKTLSYVDGARIGIWGWSFGGYLTSLCMTKGKGVFKTGIAVAPVTNWRFYDSIYTERYLKKPQDNAAGYDENSPINFAADLQGKYLLIHGSADDNVHFQNTMEWISALVAQGKQFDMMVYPNKNHSIAGGKSRYHLYKKMTDFIMANL